MNGLITFPGKMMIQVFNRKKILTQPDNVLLLREAFRYVMKLIGNI